MGFQSFGETHPLWWWRCRCLQGSSQSRVLLRMLCWMGQGPAEGKQSKSLPKEAGQIRSGQSKLGQVNFKVCWSGVFFFSFLDCWDLCATRNLSLLTFWNPSFLKSFVFWCYLHCYLVYLVYLIYFDRIDAKIDAIASIFYEVESCMCWLNVQNNHHNSSAHLIPTRNFLSTHITFFEHATFGC